MVNTLSLRAGFLFLVTCWGTACGSDSTSSSEGGGDSGGSAGGDATCLAGSLVLTETKRMDAPSFNTLLLDFDAKNASSHDYDVMKGSKPILLDFVVTTTDGTEYESEAPLTATKIAAGATSAVVAQAEYGAGKTFESYTISLRCR